MSLNRKKNIAVFLGARPGFTDENKIIASVIGNTLSKKKYKMLYGGGHSGLMGVISSAFYYSGGEVEGVTVDYFVKNIKNGKPIKLTVEDDLISRLTKIIKQADLFLILPGGIGTLTELTMVLQLNELEEMNKPVYLMNYNGYYNRLLELFYEQISKGYLNKKAKFNLNVFNDPISLIQHLNNLN